MLKLNDSLKKVMIERLENQQININRLKLFFEENKTIGEKEIEEFEIIKDTIINDLNDIDSYLKIESEYVEYQSKKILEQIKKDLSENKDVYIYDGELLKVNEIESTYLDCSDDNFSVDVPLTTLYRYKILYEDDLY